MKYIRCLLLFSLFAVILACSDIKYTQGERIYQAQCANCHMEDGSGLKGHIPTLAKSDYVIGEKSRIVALILNGKNADQLGNTDRYMPANKKMKPAEMANLLNYIQEKFNSSNHIYKMEDVKKLIEANDRY